MSQCLSCGGTGSVLDADGNRQNCRACTASGVFPGGRFKVSGTNADEVKEVALALSGQEASSKRSRWIAIAAWSAAVFGSIVAGVISAILLDWIEF